MADDSKLSWESLQTVDNDNSSPNHKKHSSRRNSKTMAKSTEALTEKDLVAFDHVAAGQ